MYFLYIILVCVSVSVVCKSSAKHPSNTIYYWPCITKPFRNIYSVPAVSCSHGLRVCVPPLPNIYIGIHLMIHKTLFSLSLPIVKANSHTPSSYI